jgi:hypothetical protein
VKVSVLALVVVVVTAAAVVVVIIIVVAVVVVIQHQFINGNVCKLCHIKSLETGCATLMFNIKV